MKLRTVVMAMLWASYLPVAAPAAAQERPAPADAPPDQVEQPQWVVQVRPVETGRIAESAVGRVGERRTREQAAIGIEPMGRISSRLNTRISSRIRSRIDRNFDPGATASSSYEAAEDEARSNGPGRR